MQTSHESAGGQPAGVAMTRVAVPIIGLSLGGCGAEVVERALRARPGVLEVYVNRATEVAYITYDAARITTLGLCRAIEATGLRAVVLDR